MASGWCVCGHEDAEHALDEDTQEDLGCTVIGCFCDGFNDGGGEFED